MKSQVATWFGARGSERYEKRLWQIAAFGLLYVGFFAGYLLGLFGWLM